MKNAIGGIVVIIGLIFAPFSIRVQASTSFVISEIQPGSAQSASEEFIQISNISSAPIDITGWRLEYLSASPKSFATPSRTIKLNGIVPGGGDLLLASMGYDLEGAGATFSATLSSSGGHLRLVRGDELSPYVLDLVGWGTAIKPEGSAVPSPKSGGVLVRTGSPNGTYIDSDNNAADFADDQNSSIQSLQSIGVADKDAIVITELLPNPASPVSDATGEFVELYNSTDRAVTLKGYKLLTGSTLSHSFVFKDQSINAHEYKAFYVTDTHATLSNSGGKAQLQAPEGMIISESSSYSTAIEGHAWAWDGVTWQWTSSPTPNAENDVMIPSEVHTTKATKAKSSKKVSAKKAKTTGKVKGASTTASAKSTKPTESASPPMHTPVLAGVGGLAVLYGVYEYRQDIANAFRKLRSNRGNRS